MSGPGSPPSPSYPETTDPHRRELRPDDQILHNIRYQIPRKPRGSNTPTGLCPKIPQNLTKSGVNPLSSPPWSSFRFDPTTQLNPTVGTQHEKHQHCLPFPPSTQIRDGKPRLQIGQNLSHLLPHTMPGPLRRKPNYRTSDFYIQEALRGHLPGYLFLPPSNWSDLNPDSTDSSLSLARSPRPHDISHSTDSSDP